MVTIKASRDVNIAAVCTLVSLFQYIIDIVLLYVTILPLTSGVYVSIVYSYLTSIRNVYRRMPQYAVILNAVASSKQVTVTGYRVHALLRTIISLM